LISVFRAPKAQKIYEKLGGGSPLLKNTQDQKDSLEGLLCKQLPDYKVEVFIAMRYWHPLTTQTVAQVKEFFPNEVVLLPLYPQFSTTTTASSVTEWRRQAQRQGLKSPTYLVESYPDAPTFISAHVKFLEPWIKKAKQFGSPRILFSAHGLPQKIVDAGDPYVKQVQKTTEAILNKLPSRPDNALCYQSKVGPLKWLKPSLEEEIRRAGKDGVPVIVVPITFVSEHSETLVELDQDYKALSQTLNIPFYGRVPALGNHSLYIQTLAELVMQKINNNKKEEKRNV